MQAYNTVNTKVFSFNDEKKNQGKPSRDRKQQRENKRQF